MRSAGKRITPCEIIRLINDLCQDDTEKDLEIRKMCHKLERMMKAMSKVAHQKDPLYYRIYGKNPNEERDFRKRIDKDNYKVDKY